MRSSAWTSHQEAKRRRPVLAAIHRRERESGSGSGSGAAAGVEAGRQREWTQVLLKSLENEQNYRPWPDEEGHLQRAVTSCVVTWRYPCSADGSRSLLLNCSPNKVQIYKLDSLLVSFPNATHCRAIRSEYTFRQKWTSVHGSLALPALLVY